LYGNPGAEEQRKEKHQGQKRSSFLNFEGKRKAGAKKQLEGPICIYGECFFL